jgi:hypothetical protein
MVYSASAGRLISVLSLDPKSVFRNLLLHHSLDFTDLDKDYTKEPQTTTDYSDYTN